MAPTHEPAKEALDDEGFEELGDKVRAELGQRTKQVRRILTFRLTPSKQPTRFEGTANAQWRPTGL